MISVPRPGPFRYVPLVSSLPTTTTPDAPPVSLSPQTDYPTSGVIYQDLLWVVSLCSGTLQTFYLSGDLDQTTIMLGRDGGQQRPVGIMINTGRWMVSLPRGGRERADLIVVTRDGGVYGVVPRYSLQPYPITVPGLSGLAVEIQAAEIGPDGTLYLADRLHRRVLSVLSDGQLDDLRTWVDRDTSLPLPATAAPSAIYRTGDLVYVGYSEYDNQGELLPGTGWLSRWVLENGQPRYEGRLISGGMLNCPRSLHLAPSYYGLPAGTLLVGNWGSATLGTVGPRGEEWGPLVDPGYNPLDVGSITAICGRRRNVYLLTLHDGLRISEIASLVMVG